MKMANIASPVIAKTVNKIKRNLNLVVWGAIYLRNVKLGRSARNRINSKAYPWVIGAHNL